MYRSRNNEWLRHLDFIILDCLTCLISQIIVGLSMGRSLPSMTSGSYTIYFMFGLMINLIVIFFYKPHKDIIQRGYWKELSSMSCQFVIFELILIFSLNFVHISNDIVITEALLSFFLMFILDYLLRILLKRAIRQDLLNNDRRNKMLIFSTADRIEEIWEQLTNKSYTKYRIKAVALIDTDQETCDPHALLKRFQEISPLSVYEKGVGYNGDDTGLDKSGISILYGMDEANEFIRRQVVDEIFLDIDDYRDHWREQIRQYYEMGITVHIGLSGKDYDYPNRQINHYGDRLAITTSINTAPSWKLNVKRAFDICGAIVGLIITGIICIFLVPAIKIADPGPVFFSQIRIGRNGRPFRFYKFRSMYMDAEARKAELMNLNEMQGLMFKLENDPRIIGSEKGPGKGFGNFIRKTSIDEFPQFWNVLKGDMSLVGTRPPTLSEYNQYEMHHKARLSMRPGITGLWQVSGRSDITDFEEVVKLDCEYIENWSMGLDFKILIRTVASVLKSDGAR